MTDNLARFERLSQRAKEREHLGKLTSPPVIALAAC